MIFLSDILVPHKNFNKSHSKFQGITGNTGFPLSEE